MFLPLLFNLRFNCKRANWWRICHSFGGLWLSFRLIGVDSLLSVSEKLPELEFPLEKLNVGRYIIVVRLSNFHSKTKISGNSTCLSIGLVVLQGKLRSVV